jgi:hypothetical protein
MYQAMCSLFLQPQTPLLFDGYTGRGRPWSDYGMESTAADMATRFDSVTWIHDRGRAGIDEWRSVFGPRNRFDLIFVNSSGTPKAFNLAGNSGKTEDIPLGRPAAIYMIHSLSAARPNDTGTLAGRWLANGAFLYFGSLNEPYLPAFRTPHLAWQLLAAGAPVSAALAKLPQEDATGAPWRLRLIGDPLYRVAQTDNSPRVPNVALSGDWKSLAPSPVPPDTANNAFRLAWCREMAYVAAQEGGAGNAEWARQLLKIQPGALSGTGRTDYEALLADWVMNTAESKDDVKREVQARAGSDDSDVLRRALDARR